VIDRGLRSVKDRESGSLEVGGSSATADSRPKVQTQNSEGLALSEAHATCGCQVEGAALRPLRLEAKAPLLQTLSGA